MISKNAGLNQAVIMTAVDIDIRTALAYSRAALKAIASQSAVAKAAVLAALDEELASTGIDEDPGSAAVAAVIGETRRRLAE